MATKHNDPCRDKAADDEPIFTLRAQDSSAPGTVTHWIDCNAPRLGYDHPKIKEARECVAAMLAWKTVKLAD